MPSESRAFFDSMKTTSFHISLVAGVKLSGRSGGFKINVWRDGGQKRYEFEGENERQASESDVLGREHPADCRLSRDSRVNTGAVS